MKDELKLNLPEYLDDLLVSAIPGRKLSIEERDLLASAFPWRRSHLVPGLSRIFGTQNDAETYNLWRSLAGRTRPYSNADREALLLLRTYAPPKPVLGPSITLEIT